MIEIIKYDIYNIKLFDHKFYGLFDTLTFTILK